jgi:hypothetical protein
MNLVTERQELALEALIEITGNEGVTQWTR